MEPQFSLLEALPVKLPLTRIPDGLTMPADWIPNPAQNYFLEQLRYQTKMLGSRLPLSGSGRVAAEFLQRVA